jgi:hypothetical protein
MQSGLLEMRLQAWWYLQYSDFMNDTNFTISDKSIFREQLNLRADGLWPFGTSVSDAGKRRKAGGVLLRMSQPAIGRWCEKENFPEAHPREKQNFEGPHCTISLAKRGSVLLKITWLRHFQPRQPRIFVARREI